MFLQNLITNQVDIDCINMKVISLSANAHNVVTKLPKNMLSGTSQSENNLFLVKKSGKIWLVSGGFSYIMGGFRWFQLVSRWFQVVVSCCSLFY